MKSFVTLRFALFAAAAASILATAGCQNGSTTGLGNQPANTPSSGVGPGGHAPATNESHVGPTNAGPAGSR